MFRNLTNWHRPSTMDEALSLMEEGRVVPHAGGTSLMLASNSSYTAFVDLSRLPLKEKTEESGGYRIGACVTLADLAGWQALAGPARIAAQAAARAGSAPLRNRITVGGSVARPRPWSDLPVALLALDASIEVAGSAAGTYAAAAFFASSPLDGRSLVTAVRIPSPSGSGLAEGAVFRKVARTEFDYSLLDVAVRLALDPDGIVTKARVAIGCSVPRARRIEASEAVLEGSRAGPEVFREAAAAARIDLIDDRRASAAYRQKLLEIEIRRCLEEAAAEGGAP